MKRTHSPDSHLDSEVNGRSPNKKDSKTCTIRESPLDLLPDELLLIILRYLSLPNLALQLWQPLGNRRLRRICEDPEICRSITVDEVWDEKTARAVMSMAGQRLKELTVAVKKNKDFCFNLKDAIVFPDWRLHGHLCDKMASDAVLSTVLRVISERCAKINLQKFRLKTEQNVSDWPEDCPLTVTLLANASSSLRNITWIDVQDAKFAKESTAWVKAIAADHCNSLEHVALPNLFDVTDDIFNYFLERVQERLKHLTVSCVRLTDNSYCTLKYCQALEELMVKNTWLIGQEGLKTIVELPKLQQLYISSAKELTRADFVQVLRGKIMPTMVCMEMHDMVSSVDNETLRTISKSCPNLFGLFLYVGKGLARLE